MEFFTKCSLHLFPNFLTFIPKNKQQLNASERCNLPYIFSKTHKNVRSKNMSRLKFKHYITIYYIPIYLFGHNQNIIFPYTKIEYHLCICIKVQYISFYILIFEVIQIIELSNIVYYRSFLYI